MAKPTRGQYLIVVPFDDRGGRLRIESAKTRSFSASELVGELRRQAVFIEEHVLKPVSVDTALALRRTRDEDEE